MAHKDKFDVVIFTEDGQPKLRAAGKKAGRPVMVNRAYGGSTAGPLSVAEYLVNAELPRAVNEELTGAYTIDWHEESRQDEEGNTYTVRIVDGLKFTPAA